MTAILALGGVSFTLFIFHNMLRKIYINVNKACLLKSLKHYF